MASSSSCFVAGSITLKRPSGATPRGVTALPSSLISSGRDQSTHLDHSASAASAESFPEAHEQSFSVRAADSSLTAFGRVGGRVGTKRAGGRAIRFKTLGGEAGGREGSSYS